MIPEPIRRKPSPQWGDDKDALILRLWADGLSSRAIANHMGDRSRNSVIGRLSRLNAPQRVPPQQIVKRAPQDRKPADKISRLPKVEATEAMRTAYDANPFLDASGSPYTIMTVRDGMCRYMASDPSPQAPVCGHRVKPGSPYCDEHHRKTHDASHPARVHSEI